MKRILGALIVVALAGIFPWQAPVAAAGGDDVPRMTKEELKTLLGNPEVVILDVRLGGGTPRKESRDRCSKTPKTFRTGPRNTRRTRRSSSTAPEPTRRRAPGWRSG